MQEIPSDNSSPEEDLPQEVEQLWLFPEVDEEAETTRRGRSLCALTRALARRYPKKRVAVVYTRNRTVILSLRSLPDGSFALRAHECFKNAPKEVAHAVIRLYLGRPPKALRRKLSALVTTWHQQSARPPRSPAHGELVAGAAHHLPTILDIVNRSYFQGALDLDITYSTRIAKRVMGRHEHRTPRSLVIINPLLDNTHVKSWYMHYLVFHECLHELIPPRTAGDRLLLHPPEFRRRESMHPDVAAARRYEAWLTGPAYPHLVRDYRKKRSQSKTRQTAAAKAARRSRRKTNGRESSGGASP